MTNAKAPASISGMETWQPTTAAATAEPEDRLVCAHCGNPYYAGQVPFQTRWMGLCPACDGRSWFSKTCPDCGIYGGDLWKTPCTRGEK